MINEIFEEEKEKLKFTVKRGILSENLAQGKECIFDYLFILYAFTQTFGYHCYLEIQA